MVLTDDKNKFNMQFCVAIQWNKFWGKKPPQPIISLSEILNSNYSYKGFDAVINVQWILTHLSRAFSWLNTGYVTEIHL